MKSSLTLIGFGEAGSTFAIAGGWGSRARVHDRLTDDETTRGDKLDDYARAMVLGCDSTADAVSGAPLILSLVTADQVLAAAWSAAAAIAPGALYCDMNSVAPETKRAAAAAIDAAGGRYVDVAVKAPVDPARLNVPLLLSGAAAGDAAAALRDFGFGNIRVAGDAVGRASSIKMIRSVMVKGLEALTAECVLAAEAAGVTDEVLASLDASEKASAWGDRANYNLDRMMRHGLRRAAEMEEVVKTLDALGTGSAMTRGTVERQRAIGDARIAPPAGLAAKIAALNDSKANAA